MYVLIRKLILKVKVNKRSQYTMQVLLYMHTVPKSVHISQEKP